MVGCPREHLGPFNSIPWGSDVRLERPVRGGSDVRWSGKAPLITLQTDPSDARFGITFESIIDNEFVFPESVTIFDHNFRRKPIRYRILLL